MDAAGVRQGAPTPPPTCSSVIRWRSAPTATRSRWARSTRAAHRARRERAERAVPAGRNGTGAVYVFTRSGTTWTQQAYLKASNAENGDSLGCLVSISDDGNTIAGGIARRGLPGRPASTRRTPCDNDQKDDTSVGAAYVFVRNGTQWAQQAFIKASNTGKEDWFGVAPADQRRRQYAGGRGAARGQRGAGDQRQAGRRHRAGSRRRLLLHAHGTTLGAEGLREELQQRGVDEFGSSVALSRDGRTLAVGARGEDSGAKGINGNQADNSMKEAGAVYVFTYNPSAGSS